jgi:hypothetical protein
MNSLIFISPSLVRGFQPILSGKLKKCQKMHPLPKEVDAKRPTKFLQKNSKIP